MALPAISRVAILRKVSFLEQLRQGGSSLATNTSRLQALSDGKIQAAHGSHQKATEEVCSCLESQRVQIRLKESLSKEDIDWAQLVISIGGDGTFLRASHNFQELETTPILGVNSSPESSFGFYCATDAASFPDLFKKLLAKEIQPRPLWRMRIVINGVKHPVLVLNDALFAANSAATTLYYIIRRGSQVQTQKSSGVWISTPAGSTAGILSAGGCIQSWSSKLLQYRVRELFPPSIGTDELPLIGGFFEEELELVPRMASAKLYIDGSNRCADVGFNDRITFHPSEQPINWIASPDADQNRHKFKQLIGKFRNDCDRAETAFEHQQSELIR